MTLGKGASLGNTTENELLLSFEPFLGGVSGFWELAYVVATNKKVTFPRCIQVTLGGFQSSLILLN